MARVRHGPASRARRNRARKAAKGYVGARSRLTRTIQESLKRSMQFAYRDRKVRKREFRALWIARINAAARTCGLSYSQFMSGLRKSGVELDRKVLAEIALEEPKAFERLAKDAAKALGR